MSSFNHGQVDPKRFLRNRSNALCIKLQLLKDPETITYSSIEHFAAAFPISVGCCPRVIKVKGTPPGGEGILGEGMF